MLRLQFCKCVNVVKYSKGFVTLTSIKMRKFVCRKSYLPNSI